MKVGRPRRIFWKARITPASHNSLPLCRRCSNAVMFPKVV